MYTMAMSTSMQTSSAALVNIIKYFKEIAVGSCFLYLLITQFRNIRFTWIDSLVVLLFTYCTFYIFLPVGNFTVIEKVTVFKSYGLFGPLYFIGRWMPVEKMSSRKIVVGVIGLLVAAAVVQFGEVLMHRHIQTISGYADYNQKINQLYTSGSYGLTQTFETDLGNKRFASFFQDPLDFAISLLLGICLVICWIYYTPQEELSKKWKWGILGFLLFALYQTYSRASILGAVIALFYFAFLNRKGNFFRYLAGGVIVLVVYGYFNLEEKARNYIIDTILFRESSALSHLLAWLGGIEAILEQPLGLGLGSSGLYAFGDGLGIGGENQLIFMGVQTGMISLVLYLILFISIWVQAARYRNSFNDYDKVLFSGLLLFKAGSLVPMLTSYFESFLFVSYLTWMITGYFISRIACLGKSA